MDVGNLALGERLSGMWLLAHATIARQLLAMRRLRGAIIVACWTAVMPPPAEAQQRAQLMRVRIYAPTIQQQPLVGSLLIARTDSFMVDLANGRDLRRMPVSAIQRIERSEGRNRREWMRYGAIGGVLAAMAFARAANWDENDTGLALGGVLLGVIGGYMLAPERWTRVEYPTLSR